MMRKLSLIVFLSALLLSFGLINRSLLAGWLDTLSGLLSVESFESETFPPEGWSKITEQDGVGWSQGTVGETVLGMEKFGPVDGAPEGGSFMAFASWATGDADTNFTTDQNTDQWLITPEITTIEDGDSLKFWLKTFGEFDDRLDILVSTTGADSTELFDTTLVSYTFNKDSSPEWQRYAVDLSGFAGDSIHIAFREQVVGVFVQGDALLLDLVEVSSLVTSVASPRSVVSEFILAQNYPNPFNPTTQIRFTLPQDTLVNLKVFNVTGQEVARLLDNVEFSRGTHSVQFDASHLPNGIYYYRLDGGSFSQVRKMTLLK